MSIDRDVIKNLEEALKIVDNSDLPSAPGSDRPFPVLSERSDSTTLKLKTDKYGIPIPQKQQPDKLDTPVSRKLRPDELDFTVSRKQRSDELDIPVPKDRQTDKLDTPVAPKDDDIDDVIEKIPRVSVVSKDTQQGAKSSASSFLKKIIPAGVTGRLPTIKENDIERAKELIQKNDIEDVSENVSEDLSEDVSEDLLDIGPPDFKMKFDFESAYRDIPESKPLRLRREKRTGLVGGLMYATFIICVSLVLAAVAWMATADVLGFAQVDEDVSVQVPTGFTMDGITDMLYEAGLIRYKALFNLYSEYSHAEEKISAGTYILNKNFDYRAIIQGMTARAGVRVEISITIPEGFTMTQIFALLDVEGVCPADQLWEAATYHDFTEFHFLERKTLGNRLRLEGFLFPDTYNFYLDSTPQQAIIRMLREFDRRFTEEYIERVEEYEVTVRDIVIIASLIEREAGDDEERPRIAAVIYNRLNNPDYQRLEIDASIHYAIAGTTIPFSTQLDSEYNTYLHEGLPPGPIASPGMPSIKAALYPASSNDYFYALNKFGTHNFFTNYNDHINFVNSEDYGG